MENKGFMQEFKEFALKGNVLDLAVAVVIGWAFWKIVSSLVADIITPLVWILLGGVNFTTLAYTVINPINNQQVSLNYGNFIQNIFDFVIVAFSIFVFVKILNSSISKVSARVSKVKEKVSQKSEKQKEQKEEKKEEKNKKKELKEQVKEEKKEVKISPEVKKEEPKISVKKNEKKAKISLKADSEKKEKVAQKKVKVEKVKPSKKLVSPKKTSLKK